VIPWRSPRPPRRAWRSPWRESATRQSFGETSHPGGRSPSRHPRGAAETTAEDGSRDNIPDGTTPRRCNEGAGGDRQILASSAYAAPRRSRSTHHRKRWRIAARTAGNLSRPPAGGRRIRDLCPSSLRRADAARGLRPNPGFGHPVRTGVAGATRRSRRLVCIKHCSDLLPDQRGQLVDHRPGTRGA